MLQTNCTSAFSSSGFTPATSSTIDVSAGVATQLVIETAADGPGSAIGAMRVTAGASFAAFATTRDAHDNIVANASATWTLTGKTDGVADTGLSPDTDTSSTSTGHLIGTGAVHAEVGSFADDAGTVTVAAAGR